MAKKNIEIKDAKAFEGRFGIFSLDNVSYYPSQKVKEVIALNIYDVDLEKDGLCRSKKWNEEEAEGIEQINLMSPLHHCDVEGEALIFLPEDGSAWGFMDLKRVISDRADINLSIVSRAALIPHKLNIIQGGVYKKEAFFSVIDCDGSEWTLHCK